MTVPRGAAENVEPLEPGVIRVETWVDDTRVASRLARRTGRAGGLVEGTLGAFRRAREIIETAFGMLSLFVGLAIVSAIPGLHFLGLGYLLHAGGQVGITGRFASGLVGARAAARIGIRALAVALVLAPLFLLSTLRTQAMLINPTEAVFWRWTVGLGAATLWVMVHLAVAFARGGSVGRILWPTLNPVGAVRSLRRPGAYAECRDRFWETLVACRLPYLFWLGLRGFVGGVVWLCLPATAMAIGPQVRPINILGFLSGALVASWLPYLQTQMVVDDRLAAMFEPRGVLARFRRAPVAFLLGLVATLLAATPLYLIKIFQFPSDAAWLAALLYLAFLFPTRLLVGWAFYRGRIERRQALSVVWAPAGVAMYAAALVYIIMVFLTRYATWDGWWSLYEQHAFLVQFPLFWTRP